MPLASVSWGVVLGCALQLQQARLAAPAIYGAWALLGLVLWAGALWGQARSAPHRSPGRARVAGTVGRAVLGALGAACLAFASTGLRAVHFAHQALPPALEGRDLLVQGRIAGMPQRGEFGPRFMFEVQQAEVEGVPPRLLLTWSQGPAAGDDDAVHRRTTPVLRAGESWRFVVRLKAPHGTRNPHGFDLELGLWERGVQATGSVRASARDRPPQRLAPAPALSLEGARQSLRDAVFERVPDAARAGVLVGLAVGDQQAIAQSDWDVFRATGVAHLMSISGLHVTMFAWLAAAAVGAGWRRSARLCLAWPAPHAARVGGILLAAGYAAFSGGGIPAQRTVWMLAVVGLLRLAGVRWPWPVTWGVVAAVVVVADPWALLQPGFWLSFVAVAILFATDRGVHGPRSLRERAGALLREQAVLTVALAPLTLWVFGQVSLIGLAANLVAIPWVTLGVTPLALAGAAWPPLWDLGAGAVGGLMGVLEVLALVPGGVWSAAAAPAWVAAAGLAGGVLLVMRLPPALRALGLPLLWPLLVWQPPRPAAGQFELVAADIGQGTAVLVRTARHSLLYDTGPRHGIDSDAGQRVLVPLLRALGERLDRVVVSHRDSDHIGGAASVLAQHAGAALYSSIEHGHPLAMQHDHTRCFAGQRWTWDGVTFEFLHPGVADYAFRPDQPNTVSCVLRIAAAPRQEMAAAGAQPGTSALLTGDIERRQELALVRAHGPDLRADLLLVPHHGSKTSSSEAFLDAVQPRLALVQAGYRNRYGHPAEPVMARYAQRGIPVVATPACGAARWSSAAPDQVQCEREDRRRYWQHTPPGPLPLP